MTDALLRPEDLPAKIMDPSPDRLVRISAAAISTMTNHAKEGYPLEIGGYLLGTSTTDAETGVPITHIADTEREVTDSTRTHVTFLHVRAMAVQNRCDDEGLLVVGYYHSHPGFGVFQSGEDVFAFSTYYALNHHIAAVIDPTKAPADLKWDPHWLGLFSWNEHHRPELLPLARVAVTPASAEGASAAPKTEATDETASGRGSSIPEAPEAAEKPGPASLGAKNLASSVTRIVQQAIRSTRTLIRKKVT